MLPFEQFPTADLARVNVVLTDIDDTLTSGGRLPALVYDALERLRETGFIVIPVTGRPAGWCDLIARLWPVDAVVGENGAFYFICDRQGGMKRVFAKPDPERERDRARLQELSAAIMECVPAARISADQPYREADLAIDVAEDGPLLSEQEIDRVLECFSEAGATAKLSSIHVNGWYGTYDKLVMTRRLLADVFELDADTNNARILFVGDSPNDAPMFGFFRNSVAVANFRQAAGRSAVQPRWITAKSYGSGFADVADALVRARAFR
jgi:HAD superfamily hydrolase (TIGR01484 family)